MLTATLENTPRSQTVADITSKSEAGQTQKDLESIIGEKSSAAVSVLSQTANLYEVDAKLAKAGLTSAEIEAVNGYITSEAIKTGDKATQLIQQHKQFMAQHTIQTETGYRELRSVDDVVGEVSQGQRETALNTHYDSAVRVVTQSKDKIRAEAEAKKSDLEKRVLEIDPILSASDAEFAGLYETYRGNIETENAELKERAKEASDFEARRQLAENNELLALDAATGSGKAEIRNKLEARKSKLDSQVESLEEQITHLENLARPDYLAQFRKDKFGKNPGFRIKGDSGFVKEFNSALDQFESFMSIWYGTDYALSQNQVAELVNLYNNPGSLAEIPMGWGKTDILLPLLPVLDMRLGGLNYNKAVVVSPHATALAEVSSLFTGIQSLFGVDSVILDSRAKNPLYNGQEVTEQEALDNIRQAREEGRKVSILTEQDWGSFAKLTEASGVTRDQLYGEVTGRDTGHDSILSFADEVQTYGSPKRYVQSKDASVGLAASTKSGESCR